MSDEDEAGSDKSTLHAGRDLVRRLIVISGRAA
jgi:hypothetical protein